MAQVEQVKFFGSHAAGPGLRSHQASGQTLDDFRGPPLIRAVDVSKTYTVDGSDVGPDGGVLALDHVSVDVRQGEIVAFLGPSGCGKSTLLNILAGLVPYDSGEIIVDGEEPRPRRHVGVMFQQPLLFPWRTVLENVLLPAELLGLDRQPAVRRAHELLDLVGLSGWESRFIWELSGGMQQRVALARVLLPDPDILLLDEPFGALDEITRESLDLELMRIANLTRKTLALVTHNVYEAVLIADRIFIFTRRPGRVAGVVDVGMPQPRSLELSGTSAFAQRVAAVRELLSVGSKHGDAL